MGGYTSVSWTSPKDGTPFADRDAMIFGVTTKSIVPVQDFTKAIVSCKDYGPYFGLAELAQMESIGD